MNKLFTLLLLFFAVAFLHAQDCTPYFPMDEGTKFEITNYDKKDRVTSSATHEIINKRALPDGGFRFSWGELHANQSSPDSDTPKNPDQ